MEAKHRSTSRQIASRSRSTPVPNRRKKEHEPHESSIQHKEVRQMNYLTLDPDREFNRLQQRLFGSTPARRERDEEVSLGAWIPPVDIEEDQEKIVLTAELPGFKEEQIDIQMEGGVLTIRGER